MLNDEVFLVAEVTDDAKRHGAKWDWKTRVWYVPEGSQAGAYQTLVCHSHFAPSLLCVVHLVGDEAAMDVRKGVATTGCNRRC